MPEEFESLVRRSPAKVGRTAVITLRVMPESLAVIDVYADKRGWTRADAIRALLRAGLKAEGK